MNIDGMNLVSSLTTGKGSMEGASTVVPFRNAMLLSIAVGVAMSEGASSVWMGANQDDQAVYPDCRPQFIYAYNFICTPMGVTVAVPLINMTKQEVIASFPREIPLSMTWSCYTGREEPCGDCGACKLRETACTA